MLPIHPAHDNTSAVNTQRSNIKSMVGRHICLIKEQQVSFCTRPKSLPITQKPLIEVVAALNMRNITLGRSSEASAKPRPSCDVLRMCTLFHSNLRSFANMLRLRRRNKIVSYVAKPKNPSLKKSRRKKKKNKPPLGFAAPLPEQPADRKASKIYEEKTF